MATEAALGGGAAPWNSEHGAAPWAAQPGFICLSRTWHANCKP
jgi:hypothetical protein